MVRAKHSKPGPYHTTIRRAVPSRGVVAEVLPIIKHKGIKHVVVPNNVVVHTDPSKKTTNMLKKPKQTYAEKKAEFEEHVRRTDERRKQMGLGGITVGDTATHLVQKAARRIQAKALARENVLKDRLMARRIRGPS